MKTYTQPAPPTTLAEAAVELDYLCDGLDGVRECYGDSYAEHRGETALYGDSWPGAQLQLQAMHDTMAEIEAEIEALFEDWPQLDPDVDLDGSKARRRAERLAAETARYATEPF